MIKTVATIGVLAAGVALAVAGVNAYLTKDDLKNCAMPDELSSICAPADAIVAVSGGDTPARVAEAVSLYRAGWAQKLLLSGAALDTAGPSNAEAMRRQAISAGVPESAILLDPYAFDTAANASHASQLLKGQTRIIVVTSPYHQRRTSLEFQRAFGEQVTIMSHPTPSDKDWGPLWWTTLTGWSLAISETAKTTFITVIP